MAPLGMAPAIRSVAWSSSQLGQATPSDPYVSTRVQKPRINSCRNLGAIHTETRDSIRRRNPRQYAAQKPGTVSCVNRESSRVEIHNSARRCYAPQPGVPGKRCWKPSAPARQPSSRAQPSSGSRTVRRRRRRSTPALRFGDARVTALAGALAASTSMTTSAAPGSGKPRPDRESRARWPHILMSMTANILTL